MTITRELIIGMDLVDGGDDVTIEVEVSGDRVPRIPGDRDHDAEGGQVENVKVQNYGLVKRGIFEAMREVERRLIKAVVGLEHDESVAEELEESWAD